MPCVAISLAWVRVLATASDLAAPARRAAMARNTKAVIEITVSSSTSVKPPSRGRGSTWSTRCVSDDAEDN